MSGYHLEFSSHPFQPFCPTPINFSELESITVEAEIQSMIEKGAIQAVVPCKGEFNSTLFLVPKKSGGSDQLLT